MLYDKVNRNGEEICHFIKCRKHKSLNKAYNGKFCKYHTEVIRSIRCSLYHSIKIKNIHLEQYFRQQEIEVRKFLSPGHLYYQARLEDTILEDYLSL
jgi:hypothetical protein